MVGVESVILNVNVNDFESKDIYLKRNETFLHSKGEERVVSIHCFIVFAIVQLAIFSMDRSLYSTPFDYRQ